MSFGNDREQSHLFSFIQETRTNKNCFHYLWLKEVGAGLRQFLDMTLQKIEYPPESRRKQCKSLVRKMNLVVVGVSRKMRFLLFTFLLMNE